VITNIWQWILHDWSDEECVKILKKCKEAITSKGKEGKVIIIDMVIDEEKDEDDVTKTKLVFDTVKEFSSHARGGARFALLAGLRTTEMIGPRTTTLVAGSLQYL
jgi:hypothetical protein